LLSPSFLFPSPLWREAKRALAWEKPKVKEVAWMWRHWREGRSERRVARMLSLDLTWVVLG
jgi:hypothetical protein